MDGITWEARMDALLNVEGVLRIVLELNGAELASEKPEKYMIELPNPLRMGITA